MKSEMVLSRRTIAVIAYIIAILHRVESTQCSEDLQNLTNIEFKIREHMLKGDIIGNITTSNDLTLLNPPSFLTVQNGTLWVSKNINVDGEANKNLCQELQKTITINLQCQGVSSEVNLVINKEYKDDFDPVFPSNLSTGISIAERTPIGSSILDFKNSEYQATDDDCDNKPIIYGLVNNLINNSIIFLIRSLDYESLSNSSQAKIYLNITAQSTTDQQSYKIAYGNLTITVTDVDDERPIFDSPFVQLHVEESINKSMWLASTPQLHARDGDIGINTTIQYKILSVQPNLSIEIDKNTGQFLIMSILDRENISEYTVTVTGYQVDNPLMSSNAEVKIIVDDVNDHRPQFVPPSYDIHINEDSRNGLIVLLLSVQDNDLGNNARTLFEIQSDNTGAFDIWYDNTTSQSWLIVKNNSLLRNKELAHIKLKLLETSEIYGTPCEYNSTCVGNITIYIDDVNDNSPKFSQEEYVFTVFTSNQSNINFGQITASDNDRGGNGNVTYNITTITSDLNCNQFVVSYLTGELTWKTASLLDRVCYLLAKACDNPDDKYLQHCTSAPITVMISSGNSSLVIPDYNVNVQENIPLKTPITVLPIAVNTTNSTDFYIEGNFLYAKSNLDREKQNSYYLTFFSTSKVNVPLFKITVIVEDVNDNAPQFSNEIYYINFKENFVIGQVLITVNATDLDIGENSHIKYSLLTGREFFSIDEYTGQIKLLNKPIEESVNGSEYAIIASDMGVPSLSSTSLLKIYFAKFNETAFVVLPVELEKLMAEQEKIEKKLESILGVKIKILNIDSISDIPKMGSRVYITATSDGKQMKPTELNSLLRAHAEDIYLVFHQENQSTSEAYFVPFIVVVVVGGVLLIVFLISIILLRRKQKRTKRQKQLFEKLCKDTTIYDSTRANGQTSVNTSSEHNYSLHKTVNEYENFKSSASNPLQSTFENPAFMSDDEGRNADDELRDKQSSENHNVSSEHNSARSSSSSRYSVLYANKVNEALRPSAEFENQSNKSMGETTPHHVDNGQDIGSLASSPQQTQHQLHRRHSETDSGIPGVMEQFEDNDFNNEENKEVVDNLSSDDTYATVTKDFTTTTHLDTSYQDLLEEPEPDYRKKVHFHEQPVAIQVSEQESTEDGRPANSHFFNELETTAL